MYKKIIPVFVSIAMLWSLFSFSAAATGVERSQTTTGFGSYLLNLFTSWQKENPDAPPSEYDGFGRGGGFESSYMGNWRSDTAACPSSEALGGYHYIDPDVPSRMSGFGSEGTDWEFCCLYCHEYFTVTGDSLSEAYKDYVDTFPATGITSSGSIIWDTFYSFSGAGYYGCVRLANRFPQIDYAYSDSLPYTSVGSYYDEVPTTSYTLDVEQKAILATCSSKYFSFGYKLSFQCPVSGSYRLLSSPKYSCHVLGTDGKYIDLNSSFLESTLFQHYFADDLIVVYAPCSHYTIFGPNSPVYCSYGTGALYFPLYEIIPDSAVDSSGTYSSSSRPTSIIRCVAPLGSFAGHHIRHSP